MIRPIPRHNPARQNLSYPKYGQFGFEQPVGRKHLSNKLSAIHRIIFNEEAEPISRQAYNEVKMNLQGSFLDRSRQKLVRKEAKPNDNWELPQTFKVGRADKYGSNQHSHHISFNMANMNGDMTYDIIQNQYSERYSLSNSRTKKSQDSLDSILNPYRNTDIKRQLSIQPNSTNKNSILPSDNKIQKQSRPIFNSELSQRYSIDSIDHHRKRNPNFLNSLL